MSAPPKYYPSPVDYEAWSKGYMPPSEHILIDKLAYRGARVTMSVQASTDDGPSWWLVVQGKTSPKMGLQIMRLLAEWEEMEEEAARTPPAELGPGVGAISDQDGQPKPNPNPTTPRQDDERPG